MGGQGAGAGRVSGGRVINFGLSGRNSLQFGVPPPEKCQQFLGLDVKPADFH